MVEAVFVGLKATGKQVAQSVFQFGLSDAVHMVIEFRAEARRVAVASPAQGDGIFDQQLVSGPPTTLVTQLVTVVH